MGLGLEGKDMQEPEDREVSRLRTRTRDRTGKLGTGVRLELRDEDR